MQISEQTNYFFPLQALNKLRRINQNELNKKKDTQFLEFIHAIRNTHTQHLILDTHTTN